MSKMTLKQKREQLIKMCNVREELKTNEQLVQEVIKERLTFIPHQKLYIGRKLYLDVVGKQFPRFL